MSNDAFKEFLEHISTPSIPLTDVQKVRRSELAKDLDNAELQAYIEANFGVQGLKLLQIIVPLIVGAI